MKPEVEALLKLAGFWRDNRSELYKNIFWNLNVTTLAGTTLTLSDTDTLKDVKRKIRAYYKELERIGGGNGR